MIHVQHLSQDGSIVVYGYADYVSVDNITGRVCAYKYVDEMWQQIGSDIINENIKNEDSYNVSVSNDGTIVAIGTSAQKTSYNDDSNQERYYVIRIYKYENEIWTQLGQSLAWKSDLLVKMCHCLVTV